MTGQPWWSGLPGTTWGEDTEPGFTGPLVAFACAARLTGHIEGRGEVMNRGLERFADQLCGFLRAAGSPEDAFLRRLLMCICCTGDIPADAVLSNLKTMHRYMSRQRLSWLGPGGDDE